MLPMSSSSAVTLLLLLSTLAVAMQVSANDRLKSGETLYPGDSLQYGVFSLVMQTDCNLVLYTSGTAMWYTGTTGINCFLQMQFDGNLVVYSEFGARAVWDSKSVQKNKGMYQLVLQKDQNLVIYGEDDKAIWASNTSLGGA